MASYDQAAGDDSLAATGSGPIFPVAASIALPDNSPSHSIADTTGTTDTDAARSTTPPPPAPSAPPVPPAPPHTAQPPQPPQPPQHQQQHYHQQQHQNPSTSLTHTAAIDSSYLDRTDFDHGKASDSFNDQFLNDTLPEIESSFVAPLSPLPTITAAGPDDTYLFDSPRKPSPPPSQLQQHHQQATGRMKNLSTGSSLLGAPPAGSGSSPGAFNHARDDIDPNDSSLWSSDAPASQPQHFQNTQTTQNTQISQDSQDSQNSEHYDNSQDYDHRRSLNDSTSSAGANNSGGALRYGKRPRFLRSRNASQRSSASSFMTTPDANDDVDSDVTVGLGADYALQSGGAAPAHGGGRQPGDFLPRNVSMGSVASTIGDNHGHSAALSNRLGTLSESDNNAAYGSHTTDEELLRTPRAKAAMAPPTDTVLTRRVMDVQVPESLAKEYRTKGGLTTPRKPSDFNSTMGTTTNTSQRPGRNMTLKEQSSTIERLSKENFDLKLKVMFLSDRLDKLSEDGVKEMIQENVEFRTNIAILQRDNKALRRRVKELEKRAREDDERPGTSRSVNSSNETGDQQDSAESQEREEEVLYLRERVEEYETMIDQLRQDLFSVESDKRRMADIMKDKSTNENLGRQEEEDVWKDLLEQETGRREQADEDNRKLRDEIFRLKQDLHSYSGGASGTSGSGALHHTTNIYNISKKPNSAISPGSRGLSGYSSYGGSNADHDGATINGSSSLTSGTNTLVEELRREGEQLRHENAELRKEVGAQTSMLTSRNREKERLYQEIEDLKMAQRRGGGPAPSTIDSLLDRSASQIGARERSASRASGGTRAETIVVDDQEREELENRMANLRDKINEAKLENQSLMQELETTLQAKQDAEEIALGVQKDYEGAMTDLMAMQSERDDLIAELNDLEQKHVALQGEFEDLRVEAQDAIDGYEEEADMRDTDNQKMQTEINERTENFNALQEEMRKLSEALVGLEDETENKVRRVQQLEEELGDANKELEDLEHKLLESNDKAQRLLVQQENSQGEIAFLREEQESDKINISRLEVNVNKAEESLRDEQDRVKQLQAQIVEERERSESLATNDKKEMQQIVNELSREASVAKDESRKLRKSLTSREVEATEWKERLMELENNLREALGDLSGTRSSLLKSIAKLQRELENTVRELDSTKGLVMEKDRIIKQRDTLLESHSLEARKVAEALDKERAGHRNTRHQFDTFQKTHQHVTRTVSTQDARINELESSKNMDKRRLSQLESTFRDQLTERNNLLLLLWTRLSAICGTDWAHDNSLINGRALPSLEVVATMLPGFARNLMAAIKHIETVVGGFPARIKGVERDLWREYQSLESSLDARIKKLDRLESIVRNGLSTGAFVTGNDVVQTRMMRIEEAYRQLKVENATLRTANEVRARAAYSSSGGGDVGLGIDNDPTLSGGSPSPSIPTGPRDRSTKAAALRARSSGRSSVPRPVTASSSMSPSRPMTAMTAGELALQDSGAEAHSGSEGGGGNGGSGGGGADPRWILRLRDLENKLKMEREGRTMDRNEAARRLREQEAELARRDKRMGRED
ncbi:anucleate primary sterigmata protein b [Ophiostoma piceae UAMH 11346]|uniref:Anucleate primary sterigmata protein b n=1 Tax=Ophiostoma piceae (strain UAMH 11346) TaxID=1262450 RepID=S3BMY1_OPHP1|nr:anucleate primary sterigmata protein b [Ophiostoma piceae UAMH 11346]